MQPDGDAGEFVPVREVWPPGTVIKGDYVVERKLGQGGFGTVYIARHKWFGTTHVIKRLHEQYASDPAYVRRFFNEGRQIRRLKGCPNIVEVEHMTQSDDGFLILVMEHISGGDLAGLIERRQLSIAEVIEYGRQIALGLDAAHAAGLVHRDIKPQNVMISQDSTGKPVMKLIDFGIAADHQNFDQSTSVMRPGSVGFAAPEQWALAGKALDGRTDLYALGATLYKMLSGRMPYQEASGDISAWIDAIKAGPPADVRNFRSECPAALSELIRDMLAMRPDGRPANAAVVAARLQTMQTSASSAPSHVATVPLPTRSVMVKETEFIPPEVTTPSFGLQQENEGGSLRLYAGIGGAVAVVLGLAIWLGSGSVASDKPAPVSSSVQQTPVEDKNPPKQIAARPVVTVPDPGKRNSISKAEYIALGDAALNSGDLQAAIKNYRLSGDSAKLAAAQRAVEGDAEERVLGLMDRGSFVEATALVDRWRREFPMSQRLVKLRERVARAKSAQ